MTEFDNRGGRLRMRRSRGAASGLLLVLLGIWGALIPFIGPYFDFAFTPDQGWVWTTARGWLEVLPGALTALGGLLLLASGNRATAQLGAWLAVLAGAWFVVGRALAGPLGIGDTGMPIAVTDAKRITLELAYFSGVVTRTRTSRVRGRAGSAPARRAPRRAARRRSSAVARSAVRFRRYRRTARSPRRRGRRRTALW